MSAVDLVTITVSRVTSRGFDPRSGPWEHRVCVLLHAAQGIIDNGGFEYFLESPFEGDPDMEDFPKVFEAIGAETSAIAVQEALARASHPGAGYYDLNQILWRESERNYALLEQYIKAHEGSYA